MRKRSLIKLSALTIGLVMIIAARASGSDSTGQTVNLIYPSQSVIENNHISHIGVFGSGDGRWASMKGDRTIKIIGTDYRVSVTDNQSVFEYQCQINPGISTSVSIPLEGLIENPGKTQEIAISGSDSKVTCTPEKS